MATKKAKEVEPKKNVGQQQANDIINMYKTVFNDHQREAFLLGRISALLEFGNALSDAANMAISDSEETLGIVKKRLQTTPKKTTHKKKTTKKEVKNDE